MANAKTWGERVSEWRASGLSAVKFAEGRDFSPHQLWYWRARIRSEAAASAAQTIATPAPALAKADSVPLARLVRGPRQEPVADATTVSLSVELLGVRIAVPPGFDRATFSAVVDEIEARRTRGGGR